MLSAAILAILASIGAVNAVLTKKECAVIFIQHFCAIDAVNGCTKGNSWGDNAWFEFGAGTLFTNRMLKIFKKGGATNDYQQTPISTAVDSAGKVQKRHNAFQSAAGISAGADADCANVDISTCVKGILQAAADRAGANDIKKKLSEFVADLRTLPTNPANACD